MVRSNSPILIIDSGLGNVLSVARAFERIGQSPHLRREAPPDNELDRFSLTVLPGVGSFDRGIFNLNQRGWSEWIQATWMVRNPILGLCLGMQLLCEGSAEGTSEGLGLVPGKFEKFGKGGAPSARLKVPHMGWNYVRFDPNRAPWSGPPSESKRFYFVHSYYLPSVQSEFAGGWTTYGEVFTSAVVRDRVIGLQFHPEKSHRYGADLLRGIVDWANA